MKNLFKNIISKNENNLKPTTENNPELIFIDALKKITEIDTELGLSHVDDEISIYQATVKIFYNNLLKECHNMTELLKNEDIAGFATRVHAMKSMLATIGATELCETALTLELAGKKEEAEFCHKNYPLLHEKLLMLNEKLAPLFPIQ